MPTQKSPTKIPLKKTLKNPPKNPAQKIGISNISELQFRISNILELQFRVSIISELQFRISNISELQFRISNISEVQFRISNNVGSTFYGPPLDLTLFGRHQTPEERQREADELAVLLDMFDEQP